MTTEPIRVVALAIVHRHDKGWLALKKTGFGAGTINGFGGKVENGESIEDAAKREVKEEAGIEVVAMEKIGLITFEFKGKELLREVHIFKVREFVGEAKESNEMKPEWFFVDEIPIMKMWAADKFWLPFFLKDNKFKGKFLYGENNEVLERDVQEVHAL